MSITKASLNACHVQVIIVHKMSSRGWHWGDKWISEFA